MELFFLIILVVLMGAALGSGFPVAFALPGSAIITIGAAAFTGFLFEGDSSAYFHSSGPFEWLSAGVTNLRAVYWEPERDTLIAIPLFIFMGLMLQRSKVAEDLLIAMAQLFGPIRGGLGISVVFVGALLAATTGIVGATVVAMGLISLPAMLRNNYSPSLATGTIAASGTLGQIIPPSIVLIILADQLASASDQASSIRKELYKNATGEVSMPSVLDVTSTSAGEMFLGALVPGLVLVAIYMLYILISAFLFPKLAPAVPYEGQMDKKFWIRVSLALIPPLALIFIVLGSILSGIATVNQAGAIGAVGAIFMGGFRLSDNKKTASFPSLLALGSLAVIFYCLATFEMNVRAASTPDDYLGLTIGGFASFGLLIGLGWSLFRLLNIDDVLRSVMLETAKTTSLVFIILLGAAVLTSAFRAFGGEELVKEFLNSLPGGFWAKFVIVMAVIFVLGFFLDFIEIAVVVVPIVAPILLSDPSANITAVWLGVMIGLNIQTSFLTPPFGFALFYLRGVAPKVVKTIQMYKGVVPFIALQILALVIVGSNPSLVNYLPLRSNLVGDKAPPPKNPKLQYCLDDYIFNNLAADSSSLAFIVNFENQSLGDFPEVWQRKIDGSIESAQKAVQMLKAAKAAELEVISGAESYKPILMSVRNSERNIRKQENKLEELKVLISQSKGKDAELEKRLDDKRQILLSELTELKEEKPENWDDIFTEFAQLRDIETKSRTLFRRNADTAFQEIDNVISILESSEAFASVENDILRVGDIINNGDHGVAIDEIKLLTGQLGKIAAASKVKSSLSKVRKELRKKKPKLEKALKSYSKALDSYYEMKDNLLKVEGYLPELRSYQANLGNLISIRQLKEIPRDVALYLARCNSGHRDISLFF